MNSAEKQIWSLMTKDFTWASDDLSAIGLNSSARTRGEEKYQVFEVVVAAIFARIRPDYDWSVTPNRPDGGIDFVGRSTFLRSEALGIDASIVIGGQCKKRVRPKNLVEELSGSLVRMANFLNPTFFVAAFAGTVSEKSLAAAKKMLERIIQRHCHILERRRIEGLISSNLETANKVFEAAYSATEMAQLNAYFSELENAAVATLDVPSEILPSLAGLPFEVPITVHRGSFDQGALTFRWKPDVETEGLIRLIIPVGRDTKEGIEFSIEPSSGASPFSTSFSLEFISQSPGRLLLGTLEIVGAGAGGEASALPVADISANHSPPFFSSPYTTQLAALDHGLNRARTKRPTMLAVVGGGGVGKSRLCDEFAIAARRKGATTVSLSQPTTRDQPHSILADLFVALSDVPLPGETKSQTVIRTIRALDADLADRGQSRIETLFDGSNAGQLGERQHVLSALALLIAHKSGGSSLIVHLQNLHWCTHEVLETIETVNWQLTQGTGAMKPALLWVLEGRVEEIGPSGVDHHSTRVFEDFLQRSNCELVRCSSFSRSEGEAFVEWMFERPANPNVPKSASSPIQRDVIQYVKQAAGSTPFEVLEIIKLLSQTGVLRTNPITGLVFAVRSPSRELSVAASIYEVIQARWTYSSETNPALAKLVRAVAMFEDRLPEDLFQSLWQRLAPKATRSDLDALQMFWLPVLGETKSGGTVRFRHENYFHAIRDLPISRTDEKAAIAAYKAWLSRQETLPIDVEFLAARVALRSGNDTLEAEEQLLRIEDNAKRNGLKGLAARAQQTLLDAVVWPTADISEDHADRLIVAARHEAALCEHLIEQGARNKAFERLEEAAANLSNWLERTSGTLSSQHGHVLSWKLQLNCLMVEAAVNDGAPIKALQISEGAHREAIRLNPENPRYAATLMRLHYAHGLALALSGNQVQARPHMAEAATLAYQLLDEDDEALAVIGTHGNVEIIFDPMSAVAILTECLELTKSHSRSESNSNLLLAHLSMAKIVAAVELPQTKAKMRARLLDQAERDLRICFSNAHPLGVLDQAAASALLLGLCSMLNSQKDATTWFAEAITCASRSRQLETLWRAHANYAQALQVFGGSSKSIHESAIAALDLLRKSVDAIPEGDQSSRFELVMLPMAQMVKVCLEAGDPTGIETLERFPRLSDVFDGTDGHQIREDRGSYASREWLRIGSFDFVIF